jgi:seryl-tRNA synthetase
VFDIKTIRDNPAALKAALINRGQPPAEVERLVAKLVQDDETRRAHQTKLQEIQARRNAASKDIGKAKATKDEATAARLMKEVADLKDALQAGEAEQAKIDAAFRSDLAVIPNIPLNDVPVGADETGNKEVRRHGSLRKFDFPAREHFEIGEVLGLMDFEMAGKVSGARFVFLKGALARLERALAQFMLDLHTAPEKDGLGGYTEVNPPLLVRDHAAYGTGNLPKFGPDLFETSLSSLAEKFETAWSKKSVDGSHLSLRDSFAVYSADEIREIVVEHFEGALGNRLWLIPTAEVSLTNLAREQIVDEAKLPQRYTAWTPCFRSEAGAAGKDTRGMIRQHQFSKVELVSITTPETSLAEHERMTNCAEEILKRLGLPFRTMLLCTGDMGFASQKTYDIEVWLPGQDAYREISSCSVCGDFQARRMDARFRAKDGKPQYVHTLNGSGLAVGRTLIAVLENYQQADGSVLIPDTLKPYMGGLTKIAKA